MQVKENNFYYNLLESIENYMFTDSFINRHNYVDIYKNKNKNKNEQSQEKNIKNEENILNDKKDQNDKNKLFSPKEKDKLFWCLYILINGFENYQLNRSCSFKTEKDFKIAIVEQLDLLKLKLKEKHIKLNEVKDELTNNPCISVKGLYALCIFYEINLIYVNNKTFYDINGSNEKSYQIIINDKNNIYISNKNDEETLTYYRNNFLEIENINKPLLAISSYTSQQLKEISKKVGLIFENKKPTKKEIYERLIQIII